MTRALPPLNALRAFEAAARHLSFSKAAEELHVTPAAISQQIKSLEAFCGVKLFRRLTRALVLTDAAQLALPDLREGFDSLARAATKLQNRENDTLLTVSVPPQFGARWLVPRLGRFTAAHEEFELRIDASERLADFVRDNIDIAVRYGRGDYPGLTVRQLTREFSFPVCSPTLLQGARPLKQPQDLCHHTLLHARLQIDNIALSDWRMWLHAAGVSGFDTERGPTFNSYGLVIQAAIEGQGVALVESSLVADDLKAGRLVRPFGAKMSRKTLFGYYLVYPPPNERLPKVRAFEDWINREMDAAGLSRQ